MKPFFCVSNDKNCLAGGYTRSQHSFRGTMPTLLMALAIVHAETVRVIMSTIETAVLDGGGDNAMVDWSAYAVVRLCRTRESVYRALLPMVTTPPPPLFSFDMVSICFRKDGRTRGGECGP